MFEAQTAETKRICGWQRAGPTWTLVKWTSWTSDWALFSNGAEQEEAFVFRPLNGPEFFLRGCRRLMWLHCRTSTRGNLSTGNSYQWVDKDVWFLLCRVLIRTATPEITRPQPKHQLQQASVLCWEELLWLSQSYLFMKAGRPETHVRSGEHVHLIWVWSQNLVGTCQVQIPWTRQEGSHFQTTGRLMCFVLHFLVWTPPRDFYFVGPVFTPPCRTCVKSSVVCWQTRPWRCVRVYIIHSAPNMSDKSLLIILHLLRSFASALIFN